MANYAIIKVFNLTSEMKNSLEEILASEEHHIGIGSESTTVFTMSKKRAKRILSAFSLIFSDTEITTECRYGGRQYNKVFSVFYLNGQSNIAFIKHEHNYVWSNAELDLKTKRKFQIKIEEHFSRIDNLLLDSDIRNSYNDDINFGEFEIDGIEISVERFGNMIEVFESRKLSH